MNERIRELAEQAQGPRPRIHGEWTLTNAELEMFTELIAKDITATLMSKQDLTWQQNYARGWHDAALAVEKHFGVE